LQTNLLNEICQTLSYLFVQRRFDFHLRDVPEGWKHRVLNLALDGHLDNTRRISRQLIRYELQNLFLSREIFSLIFGACIL
jgi:hypothetical protein